jgi:GR25 family glycosyltransferase involved in LPS biosynthesis
MNLIVISLARASERREKIKSQLSERNIEGIIMDAVDGNELSEIEKNKFLRNPGGWRDGEKFKPGEIGCIKSTINAIRFAKESNWDYVIMLDDDVILSHDFEKGINFAFRIASKEWEHILLGGPYLYECTPGLATMSCSCYI